MRVNKENFADKWGDGFFQSQNKILQSGIGLGLLPNIGDLNALRGRFAEQGVFVRPIGNVIYLTPAFTISADELKMLTDAVVKAVRDTKH